MKKKTQKKKLDIGAVAIEKHAKLGGKISVEPKAVIKTMKDLSIYYTPGVGVVSMYVAKHPKAGKEMTIKKNTVAVISDGSAVLGLGNIGPVAALPVMEGKAMLFKSLSGVDAFPIVLDTQDTEEIITAIKHIAPTFGGINLEDFSAPRCFEIEDRLKKELSIPVMHDDQHGTAIVVLAGLLNAFKVAKRDIKKGKIVIVGAGAAGSAVAKLLHLAGVKDILILDSKGIINKKRKGLTTYKKELARITNKKDVSGGVKDALAFADAVIGVSGPGSITSKDVEVMNKNPIVFALANPVPEIMPEEAKKGGARIIATGRSDFPNQINNALVFPGIFRGVLDSGAGSITDAMKIRAAKNLAAVISKPTLKHFIPTVFDKRVVKAIAKAMQ